MTITLTRSIAINGVHHDAGETLEVGGELGNSLIAMRRAVIAEPSVKKSKQAAETAAIVAGDEQTVMPTGKAKG